MTRERQQRAIRAWLIANLLGLDLVDVLEWPDDMIALAMGWALRGAA